MQKGGKAARAVTHSCRHGRRLVLCCPLDALTPLACQQFVELGADVTFLEAPHSKEEMERYCREVPGPKMANMLETGATPCLPPGELHRLGYTIAAHPITLLSAAVRAMKVRNNAAPYPVQPHLRLVMAHGADCGRHARLTPVGGGCIGRPIALAHGRTRWLGSVMASRQKTSCCETLTS